MENPSITDVLDFIGTLTLTAFLFFAWRLEREERIKAQTQLVDTLSRYADLAQILLEGGRAAVKQFQIRRDQTDEKPPKLVYPDD